MAHNYQRNLRETDAALTAKFHQSDGSTEKLDQHILSQTVFELDFMRIVYSLDQAEKLEASQAKSL